MILESFYGLTANPFGMRVDEYAHNTQRAQVKQWSYLTYALQQAEGFVLITGRPGTQKTNLIRGILSELEGERVVPVTLIANRLQVGELLQLVAHESGLQTQDVAQATLVPLIERHLLRLHQEGRRVVVIVDEAQNLSLYELEALRLLSNLQVGNQSLIQIVLIGQEQLRSLISGPGLEDIQQRIIAKCRLEPMQDEYVQSYVEKRLRLFGWTGNPSFEAGIFPLLYRITQGVSREINLVMEHLLLYGESEQKHALGVNDLLVVLSQLDRERRLAFELTPVVAEWQASSSAMPADGARVAKELQDSVSTQAPLEAAKATHQASERTSILPGEEEETIVRPATLEPDPIDEDTIPVPEETRIEQVVNWPEGVAADGHDEPVSDAGEHPVPVSQKVEQGDSAAVAFSDQENPDPAAIDADTDITAWGEPSALTATNAELEMDVLPPQWEPRGDGNGRPRGLLTDVGDLLEDDGINKRVRRAWRWLFYPLAILLLALLLLMPKLEDLPTLWHHLKETVGVTVKPSTKEAPKTVVEPQLVSQQPAVVTGSDISVVDSEQEPASGELESPSPARTPGPEDPHPVTVSAVEAETLVTPATVAIDSAKDYWLILDQASGVPAEASHALFAELCEWLLANPASKVILTGVAANDTEPMAQVREALTQAELASRLFVREGISAQRIVIEGRVAGSGPASAGVRVKLKPPGLASGND